MNDNSNRLPCVIDLHSQYHKTCSVRPDTEFAREISKLTDLVKPHKIIETGTYLGKGTTKVIHDALVRSHIADFTFITIEVDPLSYKKSVEYFIQNKMRILSLNGLSIKRQDLPSLEQIQDAFVENKEFPNIDYDYPETVRAKLYFSETDYDVPDNLLYAAFNHFDFAPDLLMLDSSGHIGFKEFSHVIKLAQGRCYILLDDVYHCKHYRSLQVINNSPNFKIIALSKERHGFCICQYSP